MTSFAGGFFLVTSLSLTVISGAAQSSEGRSVFDLLPQQTAPAAIPPAAPAQPSDAPDPLESNAPEAVPNAQLASAITPQPAAAAPSVTLGPPAAAASTRAGPVAAGPITASNQTATRPPASVQRPPAAAPPRQASAQPASVSTTTNVVPPPTTRAAAPSAPVTTNPRPASNGATSQPASSPVTTNPPRPALILPSSGSDLDLSDNAPVAQLNPESGQGVEAVRRERAGPDQ